MSTRPHAPLVQDAFPYLLLRNVLRDRHGGDEIHKRLSIRESNPRHDMDVFYEDCDGCLLDKLEGERVRGT